MSPCPDCGAPQPAGESCEDCFHALLAFEAERPAAFGAVHHLTVSCFYLQHPRGYAPATLRAWRQLVADALDGRTNVGRIRARNASEFGGGSKVREAGAAPPLDWPREWPLHVRDVFVPGHAPTIDDYVRSARAWASAVRATLDASA